MQSIEYDKPIEVTKEQYEIIANTFKGLIAHKVELGRYYIKSWSKAANPYINKIIKN